MNISEHVEHHAEGVDHVPSVQHVDALANKNVYVHDVAFSSKKNAFYVVLILNYRLVTVRKRKRVCQFIPLFVLATEPPLV